MTMQLMVKILATRKSKDSPQDKDSENLIHLSNNEIDIDLQVCK